MMKKLTTLAAIAAATLGVAACGASGSASNVRSDLKQLMGDKGITYTGVPYCTHQSGNLYVCEVDGTTNGKEYPNVTDDGKTIFAQGLN
jgi:hypothetical protein